MKKTKYYKPEEVAENEEQNKEITTKNINIEKYKNDDGSLIITTDSDILQNIDGDYKFIVKFEKNPSKVLVKYIEEETTVIYYYKKAMLDFKVEKEFVKLEINDEVQTEFSNKKIGRSKN